ncbi:hypothetical protein PTTG_30469, partial [Puccinia triticina 1-1 BBBD Race 1]
MKIEARESEIIWEGEADAGVPSTKILEGLQWSESSSGGSKEITTKTKISLMRESLISHKSLRQSLRQERDLVKFDARSGLTYSDLWTLAGVAAIQEIGGPKIPWRLGCQDGVGPESCPPDGRLPDGDKDQDHLQKIFFHMGFNDQESVALLGAHALGRCHTN